MSCEICGTKSIGTFISPETPDRKKQIYVLCKNCADQMAEMERETNTSLLFVDENKLVVY